MPDISLGGSAPGPPSDSTLAALIAALSFLSERESMAFLRFFNEWRSWPTDRRATLAKTLFPELRDADIAVIACVSRRTLYRHESYKAIKPRLADFKASRPRGDSSKQRRRYTDADDPLE